MADRFVINKNRMEGYPECYHHSTKSLDLSRQLTQELPCPKLLKISVRNDMNEGYPSNVLGDVSRQLVQSAPFPKLMSSAGEPVRNINEGYPGIVYMGDLSKMNTQDAPFPKLLFVAGTQSVRGVNENYPSVMYMGDLSKMNTQDAPFPKLLPAAGERVKNLNEGYPCIEDMGSIIRMNVQDKPYPKLVPSIEPEIDEGYPSWREERPFFGAFSNASKLEEVEIPRSVKEIFDYAFYNTSIKSVTIPKGCKYYRHSFPRGCRINFYGDEEE